MGDEYSVFQNGNGMNVLQFETFVEHKIIMITYVQDEILRCWLFIRKNIYFFANVMLPY